MLVNKKKIKPTGGGYWRIVVHAELLKVNVLQRR